MSTKSRCCRVVGVTFAVLFVACSTGCMVQPGHGDVFRSRDTEIDFIGASFNPATRIEIQAFHPTRGWERLAETAPEMRYDDHNGTWYIWFAKQRIPRECWTLGRYRYEARLRAVNLADGQPVYTFDRSFDWDMFIIGHSPAIARMDLAEIWYRWGHGTTITIFAE